MLMFYQVRADCRDSWADNSFSSSCWELNSFIHKDQALIMIVKLCKKKAGRFMTQAQITISLHLVCQFVIWLTLTAKISTDSLNASGIRIRPYYNNNIMGPEQQYSFSSSRGTILAFRVLSCAKASRRQKKGKSTYRLSLTKSLFLYLY